MLLLVTGVKVYAPDWIPPNGWSIHSKGYVIYTSNSTRHGIKRGAYMHRYVVEKLHGRGLCTWEHVHHQDFNKRNNHPSNLILMPHVFNPRSACRCPYTGKYMSIAEFRKRMGIEVEDFGLPNWVVEEFPINM